MTSIDIHPILNANFQMLNNLILNNYLIACGSEQGNISIFSLKIHDNMKCEHTLLESINSNYCHGSDVKKLIWLTIHNNVMLATAGNDNTVRIFKFYK